MPDTVQRESIDRPERPVQPVQPVQSEQPKLPEQPLHFLLTCKQRLRTQPGLLT